jgi:alkanesulfonate monooxygenase SsuD/methylene tetrahydromethanopterin reductase-like flavin-dependent oxidoreductase (luciferase family)
MDITNFSLTPMSWGVEEPAQASEYIELAQHAEELGFHSITIPHVPLLPHADDQTATGTQIWVQIPPHLQDYYIDPLVICPMMAQATSKIRLGFNVLIAPFVHPFVWAKYLSSLDFVSGGRVLGGFGLGTSTPKFPKGYKGLDSLGIDGSHRGTMSDESLELMTKLWTSSKPVSFDGKYYKGTELVLDPKPIQKPYPELWWAGHLPRSVARAARYCDYLEVVSYALPGEPLSAVRDHFRPMLATENEKWGGHAKLAALTYCNVFTRRISRDDLSRQYFNFTGANLDALAVGQPEDCAKALLALHEAGVDHFALDFHRHGLDRVTRCHDEMEAFVRHVLPLLT